MLWSERTWAELPLAGLAEQPHEETPRGKELRNELINYKTNEWETCHLSVRRW